MDAAHNKGGSGVAVEGRLLLELDVAVRFERLAFRRRVDRLMNVKETFFEYGYGPLLRQSVLDAIAADNTWQAAMDQLCSVLERARLDDPPPLARTGALTGLLPADAEPDEAESSFMLQRLRQLVG